VRCETYNSVDAGHLLADHKHGGDESSLSVGGDEPHLLEEYFGRGIADKESLLFELFGHILQFSLYVVVVTRETEGEYRVRL